jgi:predicted esterase
VSARCALVRRERRAAASAARGTLVALHADGADSSELVALSLAIDPELDLVAPQAPRARDPFHSSAAPDDPRWRAYAGYSWFRRDDLSRPEPASFGDSLAQLESLACELHASGGAPLFFVGHREGATLALGAALAFPELVGAVVAIAGARPEIPGWSERLAAPPELPILELGSDYTDPCRAADRIRAFLNAQREGARDVGDGSQEADQDVLQAHQHG